MERGRERWGSVAAFGAAALLLSGCGASAEPVPAEDAVARYDAVAEAVTGALPEQGWTLQENQRSVQEEDGQCVYSPGVWNGDGTLVGVVADPGWEEIAERLDPVLAEHGFESLGSPSRSGASLRVGTQDEHGAELVIDDQGTLSLRGVLVDATTCTESALGL